MRREIISSSHAPQPSGAYSQAVLAHGSKLLFISGQLPFDPHSRALVGEGDIRAQTERVLDNLDAILRAAGMTFDSLVQVGIFLADLAHFEVVDELYARRFSIAPPARTTINVVRFRRNVLIEIDGIATS